MQTLVPHHFKVLQIAMIERIINCLKFMGSFFELFFLVYFRTSGLISFSRKLQFLLKQFYYLKIYFYKTSLFRLNLKSCIFFFFFFSKDDIDLSKPMFVCFVVFPSIYSAILHFPSWNGYRIPYQLLTLFHCFSDLCRFSIEKVTLMTQELVYGGSRKNNSNSNNRPIIFIIKQKALVFHICLWC